MKKLTFISAIILGILFAVNTSSYAQVQTSGNLQTEQGDIEAGVGLVYGTEIENAGITVDGYYTFNEQWRAGLGLTYFFPKNIGSGVDQKWFSIDLNANYIFYNEDNIMAYGLAGFNIISAKIDYDNSYNGNSVSASDSEIGLNIGVGGEYAVDFGNIFAELKYAGIGGDADQLVISAGVRFPIK